MHLLEFERQEKERYRQEMERYRELWIQSQLSKVPEPATQTGPETDPFDNLPGPAPPLSPLPMPPLSPLHMPPPPSPAVFPQPGLPAAVFLQPGLNYNACDSAFFSSWGVPDRAAESNAAADEVDFFRVSRHEAGPPNPKQSSMSMRLCVMCTVYPYVPQFLFLV